MKIIRRLEEFDELENEKGLKLMVFPSPYEGCMWLKIIFNNFVEIKDKKNFNESDIELLKAMGFEFEWKPKRELEEIIASYEEVEFIMGENNWCITKVERDSYCWYRVEEHFATQYIGAKYYEKEDAIKIVNELNQIA